MGQGRHRDVGRDPAEAIRPSAVGSSHRAAGVAPHFGPQAVLALQRRVGNRAVAALFGASTARQTVQRFTASTAPPREHDTAMKNHLEDRAALVAEVVDMAKSPDTIVSNTARWFQTGRSQLYALTPTADSKERAALAGKSPQLAMFGKDNDVLKAAPGTYDTKDMERNEGIEFVPANSGGFRFPTGGKVFITQPARRSQLNKVLEAEGGGAFDPVSEALKHETQHESDVAFNVEFRQALSSGAPADFALATYRTEFRAYTAQSPAWLNDPIKEKHEAVLKGREWPGGHVQKKIFLQIQGEYPVVNAAWETNGTLSRGGTFRDAVVGMHGGITAISLNPTNSPEADVLWSYLNRTDIKAQNKERLVAAAAKVPESDRAIIRKAEDIWGPFFDEDWQREEVRTLLSDHPERFGQAHAAFIESKEKAERAVAQAGPPTWTFLSKRFKSWSDVGAMIEKEKLSANAYIDEEFKDWSSMDWKEETAEAFFGNTHGNFGALVDWWALLKL